MNNKPNNSYCSNNILDFYEFIDIDSNFETDFNKFKYECDLLKNEIYSKNNIINNLNEKIIELNNKNNSLLNNNIQLKNENKEYNIKNIPHFVLTPPTINKNKKNNRHCINILSFFNINTLK